MKKLLFIAALALGFSTANAQDAATGQTAKGKILIEANTGSNSLGSTAISFNSNEFYSVFSLGLDGGYFIMDDLAVKAGLGYTSTKVDGIDDASSTVSYRIGAKYYVNSMIPVTVDFTGTSTKDVDDNPSYVGLGAGYAIFLGDKVAIEPGVRYNMSLDDDIAPSEFELNIGFSIFL